MTLPSPTYTKASIQTIQDSINCCTGNEGFLLTDALQKGIDKCNCSYDELFYLGGVLDFLEGYYPPGSIKDDQVKNVAIFYLDDNTNIENVVIHAGSTLISPDLPTYTNTQEMIGGIVSSELDLGYVATGPSTLILVITAPAGVTDDVEIKLEYDYNDTGAAHFSETITLSGGAHLMSADDECLTTLQVQYIIEQATKICGCEGCSTNVDSDPQANSIIVIRSQIYPLYLRFQEGDFVGSNFTPTGKYSLVGKNGAGNTPDFTITSDGGSGTVLLYGAIADGGEYELNSGTGTLIFPSPGDYALNILK